MGHFSEMNFLFTNQEATNTINNIVGTGTGDTKSIYYKPSLDSSEHYYVFKYKGGNIRKAKASGYNRYAFDKSTGIPVESSEGNSTRVDIKNYIKEAVYDTQTSQNPYINLINDFNGIKSARSLKITPSDLAYLRELGVYPTNRMVILRRFAVGQYIPEKLDEIDADPISVVVGWLKEDDTFGEIGFHEDWTKTTNRLDEMLRKMISNEMPGMGKFSSFAPVPGVARGLLFQLLNNAGLTGDKDSNWGYGDIPIGDPDVLQEASFRDPTVQNIKSDFNFSFETSYEQKLVGDVDPGAAMVDIIDNLLKMGTSDMKYWFHSGSEIMIDAKEAIQGGDSNNPSLWWDLVWGTITKFASAIWDVVVSAKDAVVDAIGGNFDYTQALTDIGTTILTATVAKYRWEMKASIELMTGRESTTPWYLTIGNPYTPWLATNRIIVDNVKIETSNEVGFNDMPMWLKITINCRQSRNLGRNEIIRMFNNSFLRQYSKPDGLTQAPQNSADGQSPNTTGTGSGDGAKQTGNGSLPDGIQRAENTLRDPSQINR